MLNNLPPLLKKATILEFVGILFLLLSLFCSTAPAYLATLGIGCTSMAVGLFLSFLYLIKGASSDS